MTRDGQSPRENDEHGRSVFSVRPRYPSIRSASAGSDREGRRPLLRVDGLCGQQARRSSSRSQDRTNTTLVTAATPRGTPSRRLVVFRSKGSIRSRVYRAIPPLYPSVDGKVRRKWV